MEAHGFARRDPAEQIDYAKGLDIALAPDEHDQLVAWETHRGDAGRGAQYTFGRVAAIFRRMTGQINGDHWNVDDYTGACLLWRDDLERRLDAAPEPLRTKLALVVDRLNDEFRSATDEDENSLLGLYFRVDRRDGWWWRRIPKRGLIREQLEQTAAER